jgi:hypothetical protein
MIRILLAFFCLGMVASRAFGSDTVEVRGVTNEDLKKMAQVEKDHAEKALASAQVSRTAAEQKKKKAENKK